LNSDLAGIWNQAGNLTDYINGVGINYCPKAVIKDNKVSSTETTPYAWANWLTSGFRIDMSPGTTVCSNLASETGPYPNTAVNASMQIGDPFEFHGNCAPSTFKLNTMNNTTARGLYLGGMPIGGSVNGTIIGDQGAAGDPYDNFCVNFNNPNVYHTDFNNVFGANNEFYMTYSTNGFINNAQPTLPIYSFTGFQTSGTVSCGGAPFIVSPTPGPRELDVLDDIALDSISKLGGNDTSRYFGKEFLYSQIKNDSILVANTVFTQFKDSIELTNVKPMEIIKEGLIFPLDSGFLDILAINLSQIQPLNNIEANFKTVIELAAINPELKDSVFTDSNFSELRRIARLCPYTDGASVYSARVILHNFEPDSNYYNFCEFAKRPDRQSNARKVDNFNLPEKKEPSESVNKSYSIVPNPNNGSFRLNCPNDKCIQVEIMNSAGQVVEVNQYKPMNGVVHLELRDFMHGIYFFRIISANYVENLKFILQR